MLEDFHRRVEQNLPPFPTLAGTHDATQQFSSNVPPDYDGPIIIPCNPVLPVGIIGGGVGGLYAAMLLQSRGIPFEIIEATGDVGGRLKTHHFSDAENDYFNVGATRFPDTPFMERVFHLFKTLKMTIKNGKLFNYISESDNNVLQYNGVLRRQDPDETITAKMFRVAGIPDRYNNEGVDKLMEHILQPFMDLLSKDVTSGGRDGWKMLMKYDRDSFRSYATRGPLPEDKNTLDPDSWMPLPTLVINWLETFHASTGAFDRALSEAVIDEMCFRWIYTHTKDIKWYGVQNGTHELAHIMLNYLILHDVEPPRKWPPGTNMPPGSNTPPDPYRPTNVQPIRKKGDFLRLDTRVMKIAQTIIIQRTQKYPPIYPGDDGRGGPPVDISTSTPPHGIRPPGSGQRPTGSGGQRPTGYGEQRPTGSGGQRPTGYGEQRPTGSGGQRPTGYGEQRPTGSGGQRPTGSQTSTPPHGTHPPGSDGQTAPAAPFTRYSWKIVPAVELTLLSGGNTSTKTYSHVINTTTLGSLRTMDLDSAGLSPSQSTAIRELQYGPAAKVGVKFRTAWWQVDAPDSGTAPKLGPIKGGVSYTDRMARMIVYPSQGLDSGTQCTVLIAAYGWTTDALLLSAMFSDESKARLKELICRDLVVIHGLDPVDGLAFLKDQWVDIFPWSWTACPNSMGAYGYFGPGQYRRVFTNLTRPAAAGRLHFAGEGVSERHSWVIGALDASWRAVYEVIFSSFPWNIPNWMGEWGRNEDWDEKKMAINLAISLESDI